MPNRNGRPKATPARAAHVPAVRRDKRVLAGHFPLDTIRTFKHLGVEHDKTVQALMEEAVSDLLKKYGQL